MTRLTKAQTAVLKNAEAGRSLYYGFAPGRSTAGGLTGTCLSLRRRGFLTMGNAITDAGREELRRALALTGGGGDGA